MTNNNTARSVCLIENAIDRLIEYGDRIHAVSNKGHRERRRKCRSGRSQSSRGSSRSASGKSSRSIPITVLSSKSSNNSSSDASATSDKEAVDNFLYTVTKGGRRCTIPGQMFTKRLPDSWIHLRFILFDEDGEKLLNLETEILGESLRNTIVNGRPTELR